MLNVRRTIRLSLLATLLAAVGACDEPVVSPPEVEEESETEVDEPEPSDVGADRGSGILSDRARLLDPEGQPLTSTPEQLETGEYRFAGSSELADSIRRNDVIVVAVDGEPRPRLVLSADTEGGDLVLETGPARWSDVVNDGTYGVTVPIGVPEAANGHETLPVEELGAGATVPPLGDRFDLDLCVVADSIMGEPLCGQEQEISFTLGATIELAGTVDSLSVLDGDIQASGTMDLDMTVRGGGVVGGRAPVFAPCNRGAYAGCLTTPTGADFIDWLRSYAPSIPEASLPPVRICVPRTPVRVRAAYWVDPPGVLNPPYRVPAEWETCRITDEGELPEVVPPSLRRVQAEIQPRVKGSMTFFAQGDGRLGLRIPIPRLGRAIGFELENRLEGTASVGLFVDLSLEARNGAASAPIEFDEEIRVTQVWTPEAGWRAATESIRSEHGGSFEVEEIPDSLIIRGGPIVDVGIEVALATGTLLDWLGLGANAGVSFSPMNEAVLTMKQVHPDDPAIDNLHANMDALYELTPRAGIDLPDVFERAGVPVSWDTVFEFGRVRASDQRGRAPALIVETTTEGTDIDPDGYTAVVARYDTLPSFIEEGAVRATRAYDHGRRLERAIGTDGTTVFSNTGRLDCSILYSDAAMNAAPGVNLPLGVALVVARERRSEPIIPNYALVMPEPGCDLLVARHIVTLTDVPANCMVDGGPERNDVWPRYTALDTVRVTFDVSCGEAVPMGAISVTADLPTVVGDGFEIRVDGGLAGLIDAGETKVLDGIAVAEQRTVELEGLPSYCSAAPETVDVLDGETVDVVITPSCDLSEADLRGTVTASAVHIGGPEPDGAFGVKLDGELRDGVPLGGEAIIEGVEPNTPATLMLTGVGAGCRTMTANPVLLEPDAVPSPLDVEFRTECATEPVDTLDGAVTTTDFPVPSASIDVAADGGGESLRLTGPVADDFLQLAGVNVRVWGVRAGTSLDVYGYEIRSTLGEPRWIGVVIERDGTSWLYGEDAIELVDPPAGLASRVGALIWVGGDEVGVMPTRVVPRVYGVIREAGS